PTTQIPLPGGARVEAGRNHSRASSLRDDQTHSSGLANALPFGRLAGTVTGVAWVLLAPPPGVTVGRRTIAWKLRPSTTATSTPLRLGSSDSRGAGEIAPSTTIACSRLPGA